MLRARSGVIYRVWELRDSKEPGKVVTGVCLAAFQRR